MVTGSSRSPSELQMLPQPRVGSGVWFLSAQGALLASSWPEGQGPRQWDDRAPLGVALAGPSASLSETQSRPLLCQNHPSPALWLLSLYRELIGFFLFIFWFSAFEKSQFLDISEFMGNVQVSKTLAGTFPSQHLSRLQCHFWTCVGPAWWSFLGLFDWLFWGRDPVP